LRMRYTSYGHLYFTCDKLVSVFKGPLREAAAAAPCKSSGVFSAQAEIGENSLGGKLRPDRGKALDFISVMYPTALAHARKEKTQNEIQPSNTLLPPTPQLAKCGRPRRRRSRAGQVPPRFLKQASKPAGASAAHTSV
jgi:hypothetical protein